MVVLARRTSMTSTQAPATAAGVTRSAVRTTSMRTLGRGRSGLAAIPQGPDAQAQGVQVDEALGVPLPIDAVRLEGGEVRPVERARGAPAGHGDIALVELEAHRPRHVALALVHEALEGLALRGVPEAVVNHLGVAGHQRVAQV